MLQVRVEINYFFHAPLGYIQQDIYLHLKLDVKEKQPLFSNMKLSHSSGFGAAFGRNMFEINDLFMQFESNFSSFFLVTCISCSNITWQMDWRLHVQATFILVVNTPYGFQSFMDIWVIICTNLQSSYFMWFFLQNQYWFKRI